MSTFEGIIFDMDGTLYPFEHGLSFGKTRFGQTIRANGHKFFQDTFNLDKASALARYAELSKAFDGEISLGLEQQHGIPRAEYFAATWGLAASEFITAQPQLQAALSSLTIRKAILSAAPAVWVGRVLQYLGVQDQFAPAIFTGEPDLRKPSPQAFQQVADFWQIPAKCIISIGDQEHTDILPAKQIGMYTVLIAPKGTVSQADLVAPSILEAINLLQTKELV